LPGRSIPKEALIVAKAKGKPPQQAPQTHHLDRRAEQLAFIGDGPDDELLSTEQVAEWFGVSIQWLEIGRCKGYGPKFTKMSRRVVKYRRGDCKKFLRQRTFARTSEYRGRV
jgi:hypothetical protein